MGFFYVALPAKDHSFLQQDQVIVHLVEAGEVPSVSENGVAAVQLIEDRQNVSVDSFQNIFSN